MAAPIPEGELIARACASKQDEAALERLLAELFPKLVRFLFRRFDYEPDAEELVKDLAQDALVHIATGIGECRATTDAQFLAWCFTIARNVAFDYLRAMRDEFAALRFVVDLENLAGQASFCEWEAAGVEQAPAERTLFSILDAATDVLSETTAELLWHRLIEGATWQEIGERFGTSAAGAKRRYQRAQASLRREVLRRADTLPDTERTHLRARLMRADPGEGSAA